MNKRPQNSSTQNVRKNAMDSAAKATASAASTRKSSAARRRRMKKRAVRREVATWILTLALAAILALGIRAYVFEIVRVEGPSMEPTLQSGQMLLVTKFDYMFASPARGDVIVCKYPNRMGTFVKRVAGLPGDTVMIKDGRTYVNDAIVDESYVSYPASEDYGPVLIGDGQYFVMGDNRAISHDSRADDVGTLRADYIVGRARGVVYPLNDMREISRH